MVQVEAGHTRVSFQARCRVVPLAVPVQGPQQVVDRKGLLASPVGSA